MRSSPLLDLQQSRIPEALSFHAKISNQLLSKFMRSSSYCRRNLTISRPSDWESPVDVMSLSGTSLRFPIIDYHNQLFAIPWAIGLVLSLGMLVEEGKSETRGAFHKFPASSYT
jgi:hypothetical protein